MKYDKAAVIERVEERLNAILEREEKEFQSQLKLYRENLKKRESAQSEVREWLKSLAKHKAASFSSTAADFKEIEKDLESGRYRHDPNSLSYKLSISSNEYVEPVKSTAHSDELKSVLEVFKTGAPPEVGVNDLRSFGLMSIIKYDGVPR